MKNRRLALAMAFAMTVTSLPVSGLPGYAAELPEIGSGTEELFDEAEVIAEDVGEASEANAPAEDLSDAPGDDHGQQNRAWRRPTWLRSWNRWKSWGKLRVERKTITTGVPRKD